MSYVVINAITVPVERADEFEQRFATRAGKVSGQPGFEAFELMRPSSGSEKYLVYTRWDSKESFENWVKSPDFMAGHRQQSESGPVGTASELWQFEVVEGEYAT